MIHKLATMYQPNTCLREKIAIISPAKDVEMKKRLHAKMLAMADARGIETPLKTDYKYTDPHGGIAVKPSKTTMPDVESMRMSPGKGKNPAASSALAEREIQKAHGAVSNSPLKQLRHKTIGKSKRLWAGQGGLGGKFKNRAGILGGLAALGSLGLGIKSYLGSSNPAPDNTRSSPEALQYIAQQQQRQQQQRQQGPNPYFSAYPEMEHYAAAGFDDVARTPKPPGSPKVSAPGPAVGTIKLDTSLGASIPNFTSPSTVGKRSKSTNPFSKKAEENGISPLLAGAAGGVGGFVAGDKLIRPALEGQEQLLKRLIEQRQKQLSKIRNLHKLAPIGAATAGALLLAAVAAAMGNKKGREASGNNEELFARHRANQQGFQANNKVSPGDLEEMY